MTTVLEVQQKVLPMENQLLNVDAVSGAKVSSKCILKAVENAIENSKKGDLSR